MTPFPRLFAPLTIRERELSNRLVMLPMSPQLGTAGGEVTSRILHFYAERAQGGVGLIIVGATAVDPRGGFSGGQLTIHDDASLPGLRRLSATIEQAGVPSLIQLHHAGRRARSANTGLPPVAPSAVPEFAGAELPQALTLGGVHQLVQAYARAAVRAQQAGFTGVEIHCAHGYLPAQFFSPQANLREDAYGGDLAGRTRFAREIIQAVRQLTRASFWISVRLSGENGLSLAQMIPITQELARAGADLINVSAGDTPERVVPDYYWPEGINVGLAQALRQAVDVPVLACGRIRTPEMAESIVAEGQADLVGLGRALLADARFPRKARAGRRDDILFCFHCNQTCHNPLRTTPGIACCLNARAGREADFPAARALASRRVMVVCGGVAGCQAAVTAAQRGHQVTLWEAGPRLGGKLLVAAAPPEKAHFRDIMVSLERALVASGVEVSLNVTVDAARILQEKPQAVILATGSRPLIPPVPGSDHPRVVTAEALLAGEAVPRSPVVVVGAGSVGLETAHFLVEAGHAVTVIDLLPRAGQGLTPSARDHLLAALAEAGAPVLLSTALTAVKDGVVRIAGLAGEEELVAEQVVLATGSSPRDDLRDPLGAVEYLVIIGDARDPRDMEHAMREAVEAAYSL